MNEHRNSGTRGRTCRAALACLIGWAGTALLHAALAVELGGVAYSCPRGDFGRYVLALDKGFVAGDGSGAEPLIVHLPYRNERFAPEGWCVEPGANIIGVLDARALERTGDRIAGMLRMFSWEHGVSREYKLDGTAASGTFVLRQTAADTSEPRVVRGTFTGKVLTEEDLARGNELTLGKQYPMWRGPAGSGNTDSGRRLVLSPANARLAWLSEEIIPNGAWNIGTKGLSGGCDNVSVEDGRGYLVYYVPSGDVLAKNIDIENPLPEYTPGKWRLHWLVEADDVVHCFDARTGATLWKTAFARTGLNTNARVPGLKGTPHRSVCVADGKVFAVGSAGHLFCVDAATGKEIWRSELPRAKKIADEVRAKSVAERYVCGVSILNGHPVYAEGMLVCADTGGSHHGKRAVAFVQGYDAATGKHVWTYGLKDGFYMGASVNRWVHEGRAYIIAAGPIGTVCLDPKTGKPLWRLGKEALDNAGTTVALGGDYLVTSGMGGGDLRRVEWEEGSFSAPYEKTPMRCYRMTLNGATQVWERPALGYVGKCVPLIRNGHMYAKVGGNVSTNWMVTPTSSSRRCSIVCIELVSGGITAVANEVSTCEWESYVGGDGIANHGWGLGQWEYGMFRADPADLRLLDPLQLPRKPHYMGWCCTPAYADGRLFIRTWDRLACYDLRMDERVVKADDALGRGETETAIVLFSEACRDAEATVRREGLAGLGRLGAKAIETFDMLVGIVRDDIASSVRAAAVGALAEVTRGKPERLIDLLKKGDHANVRLGAAVALGTFDVLDARVVEAEEQALKDESPAVRVAALAALAQWKKRAAPASAGLAEIIRDRDPVEADAALNVLRNVADAGGAAVPILTEVLAGGRSERWDRAAAALCAIGRPAVAEAAKRIGDGDMGTATRFVNVLKGIGPDAADAVPALVSVLGAKEWPRIAAAAAALPAIDAKQEPAVASALIGHLSGSATNVFAECSMMLAGLAAGTKQEAIRQAVVSALSKDLKESLGGDALLAEEKGRAMKVSLLRALGEIGPAAKSAALLLKRAFGTQGVGDEAAAAWRKILPDQPMPKPKMDVDVDLDL